MSFRPILLAAWLATACTMPVNIDPPAPDGLADRFELVAFYDEFSGEEVALRRWQGPIRIQIGQANALPYFGAARKVIALLDQLTPMSVEEWRGVGYPNVLLLIGTPYEMEALWGQLPLADATRDLNMRFDCLVSAYSDEETSAFEIVSAIVMIDSDLLGPTDIRRCLAQELTQALGLMNDIDDPDGTVFSSFSTRETLSRSDQQMVRILYDPRLEVGMTRTEAMPIVRRIAAELEVDAPPFN